MRLVYFHSLQAFEFVKLADLDLAHHVRVVVVYDHALLIDLEGTIVYFTDADPADVFVVVDSADQHLGACLGISLGSGDIVDDGLKQGLHAGAYTAEIQRRDAGFGGREHEGAVNLFVTGSQIHKKFEDLVDDLGGTGAGPVDLVDAYDHRKIQCHCFTEDKSGLGHRTFKGVNDKDNAVYHLEDTLHFSAEVGVAGGVNDVDLYSP